MDKLEVLLESLCEALRSYRRNSPRYPTPFYLSKIVWNRELRRIELDLLEEGKVVKYDLLVDEVKEHGDTTAPETFTLAQLDMQNAYHIPLDSELVGKPWTLDVTDERSNLTD